MLRFFKNAHISAVAVLVGISLVVTHSAFKVDNASRVNYTFHYTGPGTMTVAEVEDVDNWSYDEGVDCPSGDDRACTITINDGYVDNEPSNPTLNSSANIDAAISSAGKAYVVSTANGTISNRED